MPRRGKRRPPSVSGRRRRAPSLPQEERRAQIARAATPLLASRGEGVTTAEIARAAGVAEGTLFRAYPDKNSLIEDCLRRALDPAALRSALEEASRKGAVEEQLAAAVAVATSFFLAALPLLHGTRSGGAAERALDELLAATTELITRGVVRSELSGDPAALARIVVGAGMSAAWLELFNDGGGAPSSQVVSVLLDGCRVPRSSR